jgi:hypothetical protein
MLPQARLDSCPIKAAAQQGCPASLHPREEDPGLPTPAKDGKERVNLLRRGLLLSGDSPSSNLVLDEVRLLASQALILHVMLSLMQGRRFQSNSSMLVASNESGSRKLAYVMLYTSSLKFSTFLIATKLINAWTHLRAVPTFR